ncbi:MULTISPECIES: C39 family peptidase [Clostridium]|uniref:C39 family peptidase n=2 Tax=Clostridiaceae TaxID=31979 RepID=UPI0005FB8C38|nr:MULTISPECIES: C39 family peptidase [Clostridium]AXB85806.1 hypothetical protein DRB99_12730 [Clostridium butyricum]MBO1685687.1 hypothetical protein [Clostridium butyricum]MBS4842602.1 C39 family peptidase [Clostridium sp.]MDB2157832.1 C39 family peptidase [Clostridium butyricum]MDU0325086.1 C39 family peptidase [Clostridium butyricum]
MCDKKLLDNITPFNELFYKSCFYNSLFSVVTHFNKDLIPFFTSEIATYRCNEKNSGVEFSVDYSKGKEWQLILRDLEIDCDYKTECSELTNSIIRSIDNNKPVILCVDCYYESIRLDAFNKNHVPHSILIYGYDKEDREFYIVEQKNVDTLSYRKCLLSFEDMENSYHSFIKNYTGDGEHVNNNNIIGNGQNPTYFEFFCNNISTNYNENNYLYTFFDLIIKHQDNINTSTENIKKIVIGMKNIFAEFGLDKYVQQLITFINEVIHAKQVELYTLRKLLNNNDLLIKMKLDIIGEWEKIRILIVKYSYTSIIDESLKQDITNLLLNIYNLESKYDQELLSASRILEYA